ncbi:MAG: hypothetical protein ACQETK_07440 [Pseudomonadota bacterium]
MTDSAGVPGHDDTAGVPAWLPLFALLGVLLASAVLVSARPDVVLVLAVVATGLVWPAFPWRRAWRFVARLKWFYLSLLVFYGLWPVRGEDWIAGLGEAGWRILALVLVVILVVWLTDRFSRHALARALGTLLGDWPGRPPGGGRRFARRLFLALEWFEHDRGAIEARRAALRGGWRERLLAAREWLVVRLDQALSGDAPVAVSPGEGGALPSQAGGGGTPGRGIAVAWLWTGMSLAWLLISGYAGG